MSKLHTPFIFPCGKKMNNRFMLAPLTNLQSKEDGTLSDDEFHWLTLRAKGGFGLVMTCAANVQKNGQCWPGQLGIYHDRHIEGHQRLAQAIQSYGSLSVVQLHHGGMRCPQDLIGEMPLCPSDNAKHKAREMSLLEVEQLRDDFISSAVRAKQAGHDGVEIHAAHGYILTQFISSEINHRQDLYGGDLKNRSRILFEIVDRVRKTCGVSFLLGVRLSPERFGMNLEEVKSLSQQLMDSGQVDFLDLSLWDVFKESGRDDLSLMEHFIRLNRTNNVKLTVAGKIHGGKEAQEVLDQGIDFVTIGKSAILHHDLPKKIKEDPDFRPMDTPVTADHLRREGLGEAFISYMQAWKGFVEEH